MRTLTAHHDGIEIARLPLLTLEQIGDDWGQIARVVTARFKPMPGYQCSPVCQANESGLVGGFQKQQARRR